MSKDVKIDNRSWMSNSAGLSWIDLKHIKADKEIKKINEALEEIKTLKGITYKEIQPEVQRAYELIKTMGDYIGDTLQDIDRHIDDPFYQALNNPDGVMERLEHTNINRYRVENTLGLKQQKFTYNDKTNTYMYDGFADQTPYLTLDQLYNGEYGEGANKQNPFKEFYKKSYEEQKDKLPKNTTYEDFTKLVLSSSDVHHTVDKGYLNYVSEIADTIGLTSAVGAFTKKNFITGEHLTDQEQQQAVVNTVITVAALAVGGIGAAKGANGTAAGVKAAGKHLIKDVTYDAVAGVAGISVNKLAKTMGIPDIAAGTLAMTTSFAVGFGLGSGGKNDHATNRAMDNIENPLHRSIEELERPPMDDTLFKRIKEGFERKGGLIIQDVDAQKLLDYRNANACTLDAETILLRKSPTASEVFEELIHTSQYKKGIINTDPRTIIFAEIEAAEKLLRNRKAYNILDIESIATIKRCEKELFVQYKRLKMSDPYLDKLIESIQKHAKDFKK